MHANWNVCVHAQTLNGTHPRQTTLSCPGRDSNLPPTTGYLGQCSTNSATEAAQLLGLQIQGKAMQLSLIQQVAPHLVIYLCKAVLIVHHMTCSLPSHSSSCLPSLLSPPNLPFPTLSLFPSLINTHSTHPTPLTELQYSCISQ